MADMLWNHLWQSTVVAASIGLLTLAFRRNRAHVRYWLWCAASLAFVIPFSALLWLGAQIEIVPLARSGQEYVGVLDGAVQPFTQPELARSDARGRAVPPPPLPPFAALARRSLATIWAAGTLVLVLTWTQRWRRIAALVRTATPITDGPAFQTLRRLQGHRPHLTLVATNQAIEPGIFGIVKPVLIWPHGIDSRLSAAHIEAILAHEVEHAQRRDNLSAAIHMAVQAVFWFHPAVWWIGARLIDERERACDEAVVQRGTAPEVYAEGILKTVQYYVESPLVCAAGVTGSDLQQRVERIMSSETYPALSALKRACLTTALAAAIAIPIAIGVVISPRLSAQIAAPAADAPTFEVASIKPNDNPGGRMGSGGGPGRVSMTGIVARRLLTQAYEIHDSQIVGAPDWLGSQAYDITATTNGTVSPDDRRLMMRTLLRDRFKLTFHTEKRDLPIYALVVQRSDGRTGPGLTRIPDDECPPPGARRSAPPPAGGAPPPQSPLDANAAAPCGSMIVGPGRLLAHGVPIDMLARTLASLPAITSFNRPVANLTGLDGFYDFDFRFMPAFGPGGPPPTGSPAAAPNALAPGDEPVLFTALQEQLGLKLNPQRATLDVLVIDSIERPTGN